MSMRGLGGSIREAYSVAVVVFATITLYLSEEVLVIGKLEIVGVHFGGNTGISESSLVTLAASADVVPT